MEPGQGFACLFGVTMIEQGVSRLVSVDLSGAEALLAAE
jgi:chromosome segregation protein